MTNIRTIRVGPAGPEDAKVMFVGESPGEEEERNGEPFVGPAGQFLQRYVGRAGVTWEDCFRTNLSKFRPNGNKFELLNGTPELSAGFKELSEEIERVNPNLIVSLGRWPMYYLTGCTSSQGKPATGARLWRGSIVEGTGRWIPAAEGRKVLVTFHPSFVMRPQGFGNHPIFHLDLLRIKGDMDSPEFNYPQYEEYIDPPNANEILADMSRSEWMTVDIETFGSTLACIGVTDSTKRALTITYSYPSGWDLMKQVLASEQKKAFQFGAFDINYLWWFYGMEVNNYAFDTYIAAANLMPEFPRGLDFLTSIYTKLPYYKEERKVWKQTADLSTLWRYNLKDLIAQHWIGMEQMKELEELYGPAELKDVLQERA